MQNKFDKILHAFSLGAWDVWRGLMTSFKPNTVLRLNLMVKTGDILLLVREIQQPQDITTQSREVGEWTFLSLLWVGQDFKQMFEHSAADLLQVAMDKLGFMLNSVAIYDTLDRALLLHEAVRRDWAEMDWVEGYLLFDFAGAEVKVDLPDWIYSEFCGARLGALVDMELKDEAIWRRYLG